MRAASKDTTTTAKSTTVARSRSSRLETERVSYVSFSQVKLEFSTQKVHFMTEIDHDIQEEVVMVGSGHETRADCYCLGRVVDDDETSDIFLDGDK